MAEETVKLTADAVWQDGTPFSGYLEVTLQETGATPNSLVAPKKQQEIAFVEGVAEIEREHEKRYLKLAQNIQDETVFAKDDVVIWQCQNCGHIYVGKEAPEICPVCNHPQAHFQVKPENY